MHALTVSHVNLLSITSIANTLIEKMYFVNYFTEGLVLLAIRPLKIGSHVRVNDYWQFKPSEE